ncbi:hypothetical protein APHAL10511_008477 [Amanita phalloides]|nr:hypothetical protein APHAL10511_008477 [Amanita phalloides]
MALTLPVEELTRLQVIFKLTFPDDLLTFEMLSNSNITKPPPTALSGYKLHLKGSREGSGLCLKVWAHYEGGAQPKSTYEMANELEGEHSELLSPQSTETPSVTEALLESEGDLNIDIGRPVEVYPKTVNDPAWYEYQSTTQLPSDAFPCINPTGDFVNDNWFKANTPSVFLDSNNDAGPSTLQINAHFDKQMPYNYHGVPSDMPHPTFLSGIYSLREESANAPDFQQAPVSRAKSLPTVPGNTDIDALPSPSDDELQKDTSPMSSPSSSSRPFRCLDPSCGRNPSVAIFLVVPSDSRVNMTDLGTRLDVMDLRVNGVVCPVIVFSRQGQPWSVIFSINTEISPVWPGNLHHDDPFFGPPFLSYLLIVDTYDEATLACIDICVRLVRPACIGPGLNTPQCRPRPRDSDKAKSGRAHPVFWFSDGSLVLRVQEQMFRVHYSFLSRLSPYFAALTVTASQNDAVDLDDQIQATDLESLLQHLYHDVPFSTDSSLDRFTSILRITSPRLLDFPTIHAAARDAFLEKFPREPALHYRPKDVLKALALANEYQLVPVRKALLYSIVISDEFNFHEMDAVPERKESASESEITTAKLSSADAAHCSELMNKLIEYFTPVLFTPVTTPHASCTDVFADTWSSLIAEPAIANDGLITPLETLEYMKDIDWAGHGLCSSCTSSKRKEWTALDKQEKITSVGQKWMILIKYVIT